jgi:hypothetical protein
MGLFFTAVGAIAQPKDVDGWGGVMWRMTIDDAKAILAQTYSVRQAKENDPPEFVLIIDEIEIGEGLKAKAILDTDKDQQIIAITLRPAGTGGSNTATERSGRGAKFEIFKELLIRKYGTPKSQDTILEPPDDMELRLHLLRPQDHGEKRRVLWTFPSTSINLYWSEPAVFRPPYDVKQLPGYVLVEYTPASKNPF